MKLSFAIEEIEAETWPKSCYELELELELELEPSSGYSDFYYWEYKPILCILKSMKYTHKKFQNRKHF